MVGGKTSIQQERRKELEMLGGARAAAAAGQKKDLYLGFVWARLPMAEGW